MSSARTGSAALAPESRAPQAAAGKSAPPGRAGAPRRPASTAPPLSPAASGSRVVALTCPGLRRRRRFPAPGARSAAQATATVQLQHPHPRLSPRPPDSRSATLARRPLPWPAPPPSPPLNHRFTEHARAAAVLRPRPRARARLPGPPPRPASRSPPRLPFLAAWLLVSSVPLLLLSAVLTLSLLPSEDVLLPAQPQPAQGAARLHQSPRIGECSPLRRGGESRLRARSCCHYSRASALGWEVAGAGRRPGIPDAAPPGRTPKLPSSPGRDGKGRDCTHGEGTVAAAWARAGRGRCGRDESRVPRLRPAGGSRPPTPKLTSVSRGEWCFKFLFGFTASRKGRENFLLRSNRNPTDRSRFAAGGASVPGWKGSACVLLPWANLRPRSFES